MRSARKAHVVRRSERNPPRTTGPPTIVRAVFERFLRFSDEHRTKQPSRSARTLVRGLLSDPGVHALAILLALASQGDVDLPIEDGALAPRSRDGSISFFALYSFWKADRRSEHAFWIGLAIDFDEVWIPPQPYGPPPEEVERLELCRLLFRRPGSRASAARREALECGGPP